MADMNKILCNVQQILTPAQQLQARKNIGAFASSSAAPEYDPEATYPIIGTLRMHEGVLYRSKVAINTAEAWTAAHWEVDDLGTIITGPFDARWTDVTDSFELPDNVMTASGAPFKCLYSSRLNCLQISGKLGLTQGVLDGWTRLCRYTGSLFDLLDVHGIFLCCGIDSGTGLSTNTEAVKVAVVRESEQYSYLCAQLLTGTQSGGAAFNIIAFL